MHGVLATHLRPGGTARGLVITCFPPGSWPLFGRIQRIRPNYHFSEIDNE